MDEQLKSDLAEELGVEAEELSSETILLDLVNWDSVTALTIMVILGDAVGAALDPADIESLRTFEDIEELVKKKSG